MVALLFFLLRLLVSPFRPIGRLEAENAALRRQLIGLQRQVRGRVQFTNSDRLFFLQLYRWFPSIVKAMTTIRPETLVRCHRAGFRRYWRWKSRNLGGRPPIDANLRALIRRMSIENMLWASAGLTTKTTTAHNSGENFATMLPPSRAFLRRPTNQTLITDWGFQSVKKCAHSGCRRIFLGRGAASCAAVARVSACLSAMAARHFAGWTRRSARNWSFSASLNVASYARRARAS